MSAVVPAAGKSERFGGNKLLVEIAGVPLLERTIRSLLEGGVAEVVVVLDGGQKIGEAINLRAAIHSFRDPRVRMTTNRAPERGMFSSIQIAARDTTGDPILILPGDMPFVRSDTIAAIIAAYQQSPGILLPTQGGKHGHPIALPGSLREEIGAAGLDTTLDTVLKRHQTRDFTVSDPGVLRDVDRPDDLRA